MERKYLAFDIEIAKLLPEGAQDWFAHRPLGITCAATLASDSDELQLWYGLTGDGQPANRMNRPEVAELIRFLGKKAAEGYSILTWNGLSFDFRVLADETGEFERLRATGPQPHRHDAPRLLPAWLSHRSRPCSQGGGPGGQTAGHGRRAGSPLLGRGKAPGGARLRGPRRTHHARPGPPLRGTRLLALDHAQWPAEDDAPTRGWLSVQEALALPEPDTSWMSNPWPRSKFTAWTEGQAVNG